MSDDPSASAEPADTGEEPRRNFMVAGAALVCGLIVSLGPLIIGLVSFLDPLGKKRRVPRLYEKSSRGTKGDFIRITSLQVLAVGGAPQRFPVIADRFDAWNFIPAQPIGAVFVQRVAENDVRCFHATCPHVGCYFSVQDDAFLCPCHNSAFNFDGTKRDLPGIENPSLRRLDSLEVDTQRLAQGEVWVKFMDFYTGREHKTPKA